MDTKHHIYYCQFVLTQFLDIQDVKFPIIIWMAKLYDDCLMYIYYKYYDKKKYLEAYVILNSILFKNGINYFNLGYFIKDIHIEQSNTFFKLA